MPRTRTKMSLDRVLVARSLVRLSYARSQFMRVRRIVGIAALSPFLPAVVIAQDISDTTTDSVKHATVMVFRGTAVSGQKEGDWDGTGSGSFINRTGLVVTNN